MPETYGLVSSRLGKHEDGDWYLYEKRGCTPMILFHKNNQHNRDVRMNHISNGWKVMPLTLYTVDEDDIS